VTSTNKVTSDQDLPGHEEFFDAVRRHICHVLGFDYGLIDLVRGHEIINVMSFSAASEDEERSEQIDSLHDEHQQPLTVAHTLIAQKVKQTKKPWSGRVFSSANQDEGLPYAIVPIIEESGDGSGSVKGLVRVVSFDEGRKIDEKDISTLSLFCQHLSTHLVELSRGQKTQSSENGTGGTLAETVLAVHSSRHIRRRLSRILSERYNVLEADNSAKTMEALASNHVDLIVLDSEIKGENGVGLCQSLKESTEWKHTPVILVTSDTDLQGKIEGLNAGAEDCLTESCHDAELIARVRSSLRLRKTERDLAVQWRLLEDYAQRLEEEFEKARQTNVSFSKNNQMLEQRNFELQQARMREQILSGQTELLQRFSDIIRKSFNISENIGTMLEELAQQYSLDCCFVILPSEDEPTDSVRSEYATSDEYKLMERDEDLAILELFKANFHMDQSVIVSDVSRDRLVEPFRKTVLATYPVRSLFYVPVTYEEKLLGLIGGHRCESDQQWTMENKSFFKSVANQLAIGITNARLYARVQRQATTDGLTGLFNHRTGQEKLADQLRLAERYQRNLSVVMIDVDHFKSINDTYGHPAGDAVLKAVARLIRSNCRDVDIPVRYGGEEFLLILPEVNQEGAVIVAERIRRHVSRDPVCYEDLEITLTASFGVAAYPEDAESHQNLLDLADKSLYMSKRLGRNQVHTASDLMFADLNAAQAPAASETPRAGIPVESEQAPPQAEATSEELVPEVVEMVKALASALYSKSDYNKRHHLETARFAELLARVMGLSQQQVDQIRVASLLHDVGVLSIPENIINKPGLVTEEEMEVITQHPQLGAQLLRPIQALKEICDIVENHHECWDGTGYPRGLKGEEIPLPARIVSIVDAYHAMISNRPYRPAMTGEQAKQALKNGAGSQWDPFLVDIFLAVLENLEKEGSA
jgi:diguanylate cyclase (GGDEF)-like protein/putative nucleotidyltransferase with HDIG domain